MLADEDSFEGETHRHFASARHPFVQEAYQVNVAEATCAQLLNLQEIGLLELLAKIFTLLGAISVLCLHRLQVGRLFTCVLILIVVKFSYFHLPLQYIIVCF